MRTPKQCLAEISLILEECERDIVKLSPYHRRRIKEAKHNAQWLCIRAKTFPIFK